MVQRRKLPKFRRQEWWRHRGLGEKWRRPKGKDSKMRLEVKGKPPRVKIGYRQPKVLRGLHPCGLKEVLVHTPAEVEKVDPSKHCIRIASTVGKKKREEILQLAKKNGIIVLNP